MKYIISFLLCFTLSSAKLDTEWWKYTTMYEILIQTFKDSDGDGIGDIRGVTSQLDHFVHLGIETLYFTPCFKTGLVDMGYDVIDYYELDPRYGTMEDFDIFIKELKARDMKVMLDIVINHSSEEHEWFKKSVQKIEPYTDYYVWKDAICNPDNNRCKPPTSWNSWFGTIRWTWNKNRQQYYYHAFLDKQPDLNLRNKHLKKELKEILKFWMDKGVNGFRFDATADYMEDVLWREDSSTRYWNVRDLFYFIHEMREFVDDYNNEHGGYERFIAPEAHASPSESADYHGRKDFRVTHFVFTYYFVFASSPMTAHQIENIIQNWLSYCPPHARVAWVSQDHDQSRTGTRIQEAYMDIFTIITALIPGILHLYYGQEIGLMDGIVIPSQQKDFSGNGDRDPNRLAMQWDDSRNAGFSNNLTPFSPTCKDYYVRNVKNQKHQEISHYNLLKSLLTLRKTKTVKYGNFISYVYSEHVYIFWRTYPKQPTIVVVINLKTHSNTISLIDVLDNVPRILTVVTASINSEHKKGDTIGYREKYEFSMRPLSAIIFQTS